MFSHVLVAAVWTQHGSKLWYSYSLKREECLQGIGLELLLINILEFFDSKMKNNQRGSKLEEGCKSFGDQGCY